MAKTTSDKPSASAGEALKRRKKQARQEAKLMLAIEAANKDLKKAQKRQSKAQARLEARSTSLHTLAAKLAELRAQSLSASKSHPSWRAASLTLMGTNRLHLKQGSRLSLTKSNTLPW
jgi:chromosome segregation ATPase